VPPAHCRWQKGPDGWSGLQSIKEARADLMRTIEVCFGDRVDLVERMARLDDEPPRCGVAAVGVTALHRPCR
jgi:hypothetical protein